MYEKDGSFGESRMGVPIYHKNNSDPLFRAGFAGWHSCNDLYIQNKENGAPLYLLIITTGGRGCLNHNHQSFDLKAGDIAIIPPNIQNKYYTPKGGRWDFYWIHPEGALCENLLNQYFTNQPMVLCPSTEDARQCMSLSKKILDACQYHTPLSEIYISRDISRLLHLLCEIKINAALSSHQNKTYSMGTARQVADYLEQHIADNITINQIGQKLYLSPSHIIREFKKATGTTPHAFLLQLRLNKAISLLQYSKMSLREICGETGFSSPSHMIYCLKKHRGMTAGAIRKQ